MTADNIKGEQRVIGTYILRELIESDTLSSVWHATHISTKRDVTMRIISDSGDSGNIVEFMQQIHEFAQLKHANLVPIIDSGIADEAVYVVVPYYAGRTLQHRMEQCKAPRQDNHDTVLDPKRLPALFEVVRMVEEIADALGYLHKKNIVHHQIQPQNILFDQDGHAYLANTGFAKLLKVFFDLKQTSAIHTNAYSPPEQWENAETSAKSDQYALAAIAYELITGRQLFQSKSVSNLMNMHMNDFLIPPHHLRDNVPGSVTIVLIKALAKTPDERYATVGDFVQALKTSVSRVDEDSTDFFTFNVNVADPRAHDVVVGHSMLDISEAKKLSEQLQEAGFSVWNTKEISMDTIAWTSNIRRAVKKTGVVVVILNAEDSMESNWVNTIIKYARRLHTPLYAIRLKGAHRHRGVFDQIIDGDDQDGLPDLIKAIQAGL